MMRDDSLRAVEGGIEVLVEGGGAVNGDCSNNNNNILVVHCEMDDTVPYLVLGNTLEQHV
jgi:hypothetical protein